MVKNARPVIYNDHWFILLFIPFIAAINYYLTYVNIRLNTFLIVTFVLDTLEGYAAWYGARAFIIYLDNKIPWPEAPVKRLSIQVPVVAFIVVAILSVLTEIVNAIARDKPVDPSFYSYDIFIFVIWSLLINSIYLGLYFYQLYQQKTLPVQKFIVSKNGNVRKVIYLADIQFVLVENQCTFVFGNSGKQILTDYTLERLEKILRYDNFFRANRQCIVTKGIIDKVSREKDGKLILTLKRATDLPDNIVISRLKASAFKEWVNGSQTS